jgi:hypothetical protein
MGVALACVACTILFAFAVLNPISANVINVNPFAPTGRMKERGGIEKATRTHGS